MRRGCVGRSYLVVRATKLLRGCAVRPAESLAECSTFVCSTPCTFMYFCLVHVRVTNLHVKLLRNPCGVRHGYAHASLLSRLTFFSLLSPEESCMYRTGLQENEEFMWRKKNKHTISKQLAYENDLRLRSSLIDGTVVKTPKIRGLSPSFPR